MSTRILIVDDTESIRQQLRQDLESFPDCEVCGEALDGVEAIETAVRLRPDLVIMDLVMPRMNGLQAAATLQIEMPKLPIILFTAHIETVPQSLASKFGISAVVAKSEKITVLHELVQKLGKPLKSAPA